MWVCSSCNTRHETDRMFCPKCGAPSKPSNSSARPPQAQSRPPQPSQTPPGPVSRGGQIPQNAGRPQAQPQRPNSSSGQAKPPQINSPFVDDIEAPRKPKTDPLKIAQKQVLRAAERFKEEDSTVEDPDEHLTWDSASALERSIDNIKRSKEKRADHLFGDSVHDSPTVASRPSSTITGDGVFNGASDLKLTPNMMRLVYGAIIAGIGLIGYLIGAVSAQSNSATPEDTTPQVNFFTGKSSVTSLEGLWLGTDNAGGAPASVEYLFNRPGSLTILTLSPAGAVTGVTQDNYQFTQSQLTTSQVGAPTTPASAIAPVSASVTSGSNMITLKSDDRIIVLRRPLSVIGNWAQVGTEGSGYRYTFNSSGTATLPDPTSTTTPPKTVSGNYVIAGNTLTFTQPGSITPPIKWIIAFNTSNLSLTSTDANGTSNTIQLHPG